MKFDLTGHNIDNLLKTLYFKKITLHNLERVDYNHVIFEIDDKFAKKVKRYIANFKVKTTLSKFKQIPQFLLQNLGIVIGVFIGIVLYIFLSSYTWQIEVYGMEELSKDEIISVLSENGIKTGKINLQTNEEIEDVLLNNYNRIAQVSVIKQGTAIIINLSEKLIYTENEYEPIKAKHNGIITNVKIITGTTNIKVGDYVNVGDILVLPFNVNKDGEKVSVKPLAEIEAQIFIVGKAELNKTEKVLQRTGNTHIEYKYKLFNKEIFSSKNKNSFALFETDVYNENISELIPLTRDVYTFYELDYAIITHDFEKERDELKEYSIDLAYKNLPVGKILDKETKISIVGEKMFACTTIVVLGNINA